MTIDYIKVSDSSGLKPVSNIAYKYFIKRKRGHLVAITSIASIRGDRQCPAYNASKAFQSNYLQGLRQKLKRKSSKKLILPE